MSSTTFEDEYEEFDDEIEDDLDEERTLSGLTVLLMGLVMLGAIFTVAWMSYQMGTRNNGAADRLITADPEPVKIENSALADGTDNLDRAVYDRFDGDGDEPVEVIAAGPEEPLDRGVGDDVDPITALVENGDGGNVADDAVADRIAALAAADATLRQGAAGPARTEPEASNTARPATRPTPASTTTRPPASASSTVPATAGASSAVTAAGALSGSHLVQVGAFRSEDEANGVWDRLTARLGTFTAGKTTDIERADLGDRGVYYRLRIGPFASRDAAVEYCEGLKERSQDCLVRAK